MRAFTTGVYPRQDRFLYDFNERYRKQMGQPLLGRGSLRSLTVRGAAAG
ncbi:MAG: hypothetical protein WD096_06400 [Actinomycetota bacterium]